MDMINAWLNEHYISIICIAAGFGFRFGAMQFLAVATKSSAGGGGGGGGDFDTRGGGGGRNMGGGGGGGGPARGTKLPTTKNRKWNKTRIIKFLTLLFVAASGCVLAFGAYPFATWLIGLGGTWGGIIAVISGVATLWAGWYALSGMVALLHDMTDGTPDREAFSAGFWVPVTLPLGWGALVELFTNPRGGATGVATVAVSMLTVFYGHKILKEAHAAGADGHYKMWMYFAWAISLFIGVIHIAALAYLNQLAGEYLPEWAAWSLRIGMVVLGIIFFCVGLGDWLRDWTPEMWSQWAAMYSTPTLAVLTGAVVTVSASAKSTLDLILGTIS